MKCINKRIKAVMVLVVCICILSSCGSKSLVCPYPELSMDKDLSSNSRTAHVQGFADDLCVTTGDLIPEGMENLETTAGLFSLDSREVLYSYHVNDQMYPASITKIMTALVFFENYSGDYSDVLTASENVKVKESGAQVCGFAPGDQIPLDVVLNGMLIYSGNDAAVMIAEFIGGSEQNFAEMMNKEAKKLGATKSHFVNPHGLSNDQHYTTAYDLYLIFNQVMKYDKFLEIIEKKQYTGSYTTAAGNEKNVKWDTTNLFLTGGKETPENMIVLGGKTGTTSKAGSCLILLSEDSQQKRYVSVIMKAKDKTALYEEMTELLKKAGNVS